MDIVQETRALWQRRQFAWGEHDCIMAVANYMRDVTGVDPAAAWRGTYSDEAGAQAIYEAHGGVFGLFDYGARLAGFDRCAAHHGAPVVCRVGSIEAAGIYMSGRVAFVAAGRGLTEARAPILGAWDIWRR